MVSSPLIVILGIFFGLALLSLPFYPLVRELFKRLAINDEITNNGISKYLDFLMAFAISFILFWFFTVISFYIAIWSGVFSLYLVVAISILIIVGIYAIFYFTIGWHPKLPLARNFNFRITIKKTKFIKDLPWILWLTLFLLIIFYAFYFRFNNAINQIVLPQVDPYGHFFHTKLLLLGKLTGNVNYYNDYPKGFHSLTAMISIITGLKPYDIFRFIGPCLSLLTVISIMILLARWCNIYASLIGGLIASGFTFSKTTTEFAVRGILSTPEIAAFFILIVWIYFTFKAMNSISKFHDRFSKMSLILISLIAIPIILILLVHPYSGIFVGVLAIIMALSMFLFPSTQDRGHYYLKIVKGIIIIFIFLMILMIPIFIWTSLNNPPWEDTLWTIFTIKKWNISSYFWTIPIVMAIFTIYSIIKKIKWNVFVGFAGLIFFFIGTTGILLPIYLPHSRSYPYIGLVYILLFSTIIGNMLLVPGKIDEKYSDFNKKFRNYYRKLSASLCIVILILITISYRPLSTPRITAFGSEEGVKVALEIVEDYEEGEAVIYSEKLFLINLEQTIVEPKLEHRDLELLLKENATNYFPSIDVFVFVDIFIDIQSEAFRDPFSFETTSLSIKIFNWIREYSLNHTVIDYYMKGCLRVYHIPSK